MHTLGTFSHGNGILTLGKIFHAPQQTEVLLSAAVFFIFTSPIFMYSIFYFSFCFFFLPVMFVFLLSSFLYFFSFFFYVCFFLFIIFLSSFYFRFFVHFILSYISVFSKCFFSIFLKSENSDSFFQENLI